MDDVIAGLLVTEGFTSVEDIVAVDDEELAGIEGFDESVAAELKRRAEAFLEKRDGELDEKRRELGVEDAVAEVGGFTPAQLVALGEKGVKTLDDLADLASDELIEILGAEAMDEETANADHHGGPPALVRRRDARGGGGERRRSAGEDAGEERAAAEPAARREPRGGRPVRERTTRRRLTGLARPGPRRDGPEDAPEKGPLRRCIVTRESGPKEAMIRFVLDPDRNLVPDLEGRLPGRGMWLSARADVIEHAAKRGAFAKAARGEVHVPPDLRARIEDGLRGRIRDLVGFARRGGQAVCGRRIGPRMAAGRPGRAAGAGGGRQPGGTGQAGRPPREVPVVAPLDAADLGALFGRDHAVHVAVAPGRLAGRDRGGSRHGWPGLLGGRRRRRAAAWRPQAGRRPGAARLIARPRGATQPGRDGGGRDAGVA